MEATLLQAGIAGAVLAWFMLRAEKLWGQMIQSQEETQASINRLARAQLLLTIASDSTPPSVRKLAQELKSEVDIAEEARVARSRRRSSGPPPS